LSSIRVSDPIPAFVMPGRIQDVRHNMKTPIYIYTLFDTYTNKPSCTGIQIGDKTIIKELFRPGAKKLLTDIYDSIKFVRDVIVRANENNIPVVISDFKLHLKVFDIPLIKTQYNVYDLNFPAVPPSESDIQDHANIQIIIAKMQKQALREYQKVFANAAVVYEDLERMGLLYNYKPIKPIYSQRTYTGRSKTTQFNIQGLADNCLIWPGHCSDKHVLLHFDWICADIRAASLLSGDRVLSQSFVESDPYTYMMHFINNNSIAEDPDTPPPNMTRAECKFFLLKSINSMDLASEPLLDIYKDLGKWIRKTREQLYDGSRYSETILGRKFHLQNSKNILAALNASMQGSVAHAMQAVIRKIWEQSHATLITEIHDSLVISCVPNSARMAYVIDHIAQIMLHPYEGLIDDNPVFPLKVSIGQKWKKWKLYRVYRENGITNV